MPRMILTVTEEMEADLKAEAQKRGATLSGLARLYLAQGLSQDAGMPIERYIVASGGDRRHKSDNTEETNDIQ